MRKGLLASACILTVGLCAFLGARMQTDTVKLRLAAALGSGGEELEQAVRRLLADEAERGRLGRASRELVLALQGATERTIGLVARLLHADSAGSQAA
jgi:hypothetical protein